MEKFEIKTMREVREELSTFYGMDFIQKADYIDRLDKKWVSVESLIEKLDKVWHKINTCKMDKLRDNFITKTQVASYLGQLLKELGE